MAGVIIDPGRLFSRPSRTILSCNALRDTVCPFASQP
jgi:hypothetical protein